MKRLSHAFQIVIILVFAHTFAQPAPEIIVKPKWHHYCIKPKSIRLPDEITEGSGLVAWNGRLWTHNDSGAPMLFAIDTCGKIIDRYPLPGTKNNDWEELSHDADYFYLGDTGNNVGGRDVLHILRIDKSTLLDHQPVIDTIAFTWPETMTKGVTRKTNFDCEAMAVIGNSIYLFTKEWKYGRRSRVFAIGKKPGNYKARYITTLRTRILVTGASWDANKKQLVLCGYNLWARPFLMVLSGFKGNDFFSGKGRKVRFKKAFRQVEGITTFDARTYYAISEGLHFMFLNTRQELHRVTITKK